ncbi:MAG: porin family protein [Psychromonas sp.]|nr:porin family protein [Psychromonas sp.]
MNKLRLSLFVLSISIASSFAHGAVQSDTKQAVVPKVPKQAVVPSDTKQATDIKSKIKGLYFGGGIGVSNIYQARETSSIALDSMDDSFSTSIKTSFNLLAGYQFNRIFALEFVFTDFGNLNFDDELQATSLPAKYSPFGFSTQANIGYTFKNGWRPFALLGITVMSLNPGEPSIPGSNDLNKTPTTLLTGVGIEYQPAALSGVIFRVTGSRDWYTVDYNYPNVDGGAKMFSDLAMIQNISIGAGYKF